MKRKIVAGNWKMNKTLEEGLSLCNEISAAAVPSNVNVILAVPFIHLNACAELVVDDSVSIAAQNCSRFEKGAYTGEVSAEMIYSTGAKYVLIGHSERRQHFNESNAVLAEKVNRALKANLLPIYCCGETLEQRQAGKQLETVKQQVEEGLFHLDEKEFNNIVLAYEPVWAIGSGLTATPSQAQEMHGYLRSFIAKKYGDKAAGNLQILYGGSCNPLNAAELFSRPDVDGGLIGGASLKAGDFLAIINAAAEV